MLFAALFFELGPDDVPSNVAFPGEGREKPLAGPGPRGAGGGLGPGDPARRSLTREKQQKGFWVPLGPSQRTGFAFENDLFGCLVEGALIMTLLFLRKAASLGGAPARKGQPCVMPTLMNGLGSAEIFHPRSMVRGL